MTKTFDELAQALRDVPPDHDLSSLEAQVWRRLDEEAGWAFFGPSISPRASLAAARMSLGALMLMAGLGLGAALAGSVGAEMDELAVFSTQAPFAPSSLLPRP